MPLTYYKDNKGIIQPFAIVKRDGTTPKVLTGITVTWTFKERDGTIPAFSPITCLVTNEVSGLCQGTIPAGAFTSETKYRCQLNLSDGADYDEDTRPFWASIEDNNS